MPISTKFGAIATPSTKKDLWYISSLLICRSITKHYSTMTTTRKVSKLKN